MISIAANVVTPVRWITSSFSGGGNNCVEVAILDLERIAVRDSKDPDGPMLILGRSAWCAFVRWVRAGEFCPDGPAAPSA